MKSLKGYISLLLFLCLALSVQAQRDRVIDNRSKGKSPVPIVNRRISPAPRPAGRVGVPAKPSPNRKANVTTVANGSGKRMPGKPRYDWMLPAAPGKNGYWVSKSANAKKDYPLYDYSVRLPFSDEYPFYRENGTRKSVPRINSLSISQITDRYENKEALSLEAGKFRSYVFNGKTPGAINVHYARRINLGLVSFNDNRNHYLVVDTLYVPRATTINGTLLSLSRQKRALIKVIANCIIYESPIFLNATSGFGTDFLFAANRIIFKSQHKDLKSFQTSPAPLFAINANGDKNKIYAFKADRRNKRTEQLLINRLYINVLQYYLDQIATTHDAWKKDQLLAKFQYYRFEKVDHVLLSEDRMYQELFHKLLEQVEKYGATDRERMLVETKILVDGALQDLPRVPFQYYALPAQASLLPMQHAETQRLDKLGEIYYSPTGESKIQLHLNVSLDYNPEQIKQANRALRAYDTALNPKFPGDLAFIQEQPLKINGRTVGRIIPAGNQHIRLEIDLPDDGLALRRLFMPSFNFDLDYTIRESNTLYSQTLAVAIDRELTDAFDNARPLASFNVIEQNKLTEKVVLASMLRPSQEDQDALKYIEVTLAFHFGEQTVFKGPYLLSHYALTIGSEIEIPFVKYSENYQVEVKGKAFYENGEQEIKPFETNDQIIVIDENRLLQH
ncbi:hypothetical protein [Flavilitoribacter nigricans]|uniref:Uncharacterized protein n=1 Tax=Flavilitoribacter nigricans (strain ATCC 23147 / DSM 23189 / NBRC 102662 / NCIMB 1420 / SS-2) TaxID=1122177 RepID=A0A2D0MZ70_FLAN2|nr:hypothetical protein [Flavilitoribacter nigricans]PHN01582.1 hypothetical protein CRP01_36395 [Flavilitoribacter nigricans DSM 23189 = NBRC 102662]